MCEPIAAMIEFIKQAMTTKGRMKKNSGRAQLISKESKRVVVVGWLVGWTELEMDAGEAVSRRTLLEAVHTKRFRSLK